MFLGGLATGGSLAGRYLVDLSWPDGGVSSIPQDQIESIVDEKSGEPVEFGNPLVPGHPSTRGG